MCCVTTRCLATELVQRGGLPGLAATGDDDGDTRAHCRPKEQHGINVALYHRGQIFLGRRKCQPPADLGILERAAVLIDLQANLMDDLLVDGNCTTLGGAPAAARTGIVLRSGAMPTGLDVRR